MLDRAGVRPSMRARGSSRTRRRRLPRRRWSARRFRTAPRADRGRRACPACPSCRASSSPSPPTRCWRTSTPCPSGWRWSAPAISALELASIFSALGRSTTLILRGDLPLRGFERRPAPASDRRDRGARRDHAGTRPWSSGSSAPARAAWSPAAARSRSTALVYATGRRPVPQTAASAWRRWAWGSTTAAPSRSTTPTAATCPASSPSATAATMPARRWTASQFDLTPVAIAEGRALAETPVQRRTSEVAYDTIADRHLRLCPQAASVGLSRGEGARPGPRGPDLPHQLPADAPHADRQHRADHDEAGRRQGHRPGAGLPHGGRGCRRDHPGLRRGLDSRRHQGGFRRHRGAASDGGRGIRHHVPAGHSG